MIKNAHYHTPFYFEDIRKDLYMQFFRHFSYRSFLTRAVMGISALCLFASQGLSVSAATIKEENIAHNQALAIQSNEVANWPTGPVVSAESAILMDADTGSDPLCQKYPSAGIPCQYHQNSDNIDRIRALQHG